MKKILHIYTPRLSIYLMRLCSFHHPKVPTEKKRKKKKKEVGFTVLIEKTIHDQPK